MCQAAKTTPSTIAVVNGQAVDHDRYGGVLGGMRSCLQLAACDHAPLYQQLGPGKVAMTQTLDAVLVAKYGQAHGVTVSAQEVANLTPQQRQSLQQMLAQGGSPLRWRGKTWR
jgi:hypothetical protein